MALNIVVYEHNSPVSSEAIVPNPDSVLQSNEGVLFMSGEAVKVSAGPFSVSVLADSDDCLTVGIPYDYRFSNNLWIIDRHVRDWWLNGSKDTAFITVKPKPGQAAVELWGDAEGKKKVRVERSDGMSGTSVERVFY